MTIRDKTTGAGGNRAYEMVRSKISKGPDSYGKVVTVEREKMMQKLGYDPGPNNVFMHKTGGSHFDPKGDPGKMGTRAENTADSNKARGRSRKVRQRIMDSAKKS